MAGVSALWFLHLRLQSSHVLGSKAKSRRIISVCSSSNIQSHNGAWKSHRSYSFSRKLVNVDNSTRRSSLNQALSTSSSSKHEQAEIAGLRHTVWDQQDLRPMYPKLDKDMDADVVVVGAGIAGVSVAYNLIKEGKSVVLLEAKARGSGQTGRTTAHIMPWNDDYYYQLEEMHGHGKAKLIGEGHRAAIEWVENVVKQEKIDCHFSRLDGYLFPHEDSDSAHKVLEKEYDACFRIGLDVKMVDLGHDASFGSIGKAIHFPGSAEFHPLMYLSALVDAFVRRGGKFFEQTRVMEIDGRKVKSQQGATVTAKAVVIATNSPLNHDLLVHARQLPTRTYVVGLKVPKNSVKRAQWWDTKDPYHYVRLEQKDNYDVLIVGGEDTDTGMKASDLRKIDPYAALTDWARKRWTMAGDVLYKWTGQVFEPADNVHLIGYEPLSGREQYIVTGDSGQGMTGGTIAGILIKDMIMGHNSPWENVYAPRRGLPLSKTSMESVLEESAHTFQGYKDRIPYLGSESVGMDDLHPGIGAVIQKGLHKLAVYKDDNGKTHCHSAICPHMKCILRWNPIDSTFDCPCHGSIFDPYGRVINGPAKADLFPPP